MHYVKNHNDLFLTKIMQPSGKFKFKINDDYNKAHRWLVLRRIRRRRVPYKDDPLK